MFVNYNGVAFDILTTNSHGMEAVYSDDGADYLYTKFHIDVTAVMNPGATTYPQGSTIPPGVSIQQVRQLLLAPRAFLFISDGQGNMVVRCPEQGFPCDVANGPFPRRCEVTKVIGSKTWIMRWSCDFALIECPAAANGSGLISHRYTQTHTINQYHLTTRTTTGRMKFRSDVLQAAGVFAHELFTQQNVTGIGLPDSIPGFQRDALDVTVDSDGLGLNYRLRDVEKMWDKGEDGADKGGSGIIRLEGSAGVMAVSSKEGPACGSTIAQVSIRAWGNKFSNQWTMIQRCFQIVIAKMAIDPTQPPIGFVIDASIRESLGEDDKWVDVSITFMQYPVGNASTLGPGSLRLDPVMSDVFDVMESVFGDNAGRNPDLPNSAGTQGTAEITLMTAALKQACSDTQASNAANNPEAAGPEAAPYLPAINVQSTPPVNDRQSLYDGSSYNPSTQNTPTPYTHYRGSIEYEIMSHVLTCPTTGPPPNSGGGSSGNSGGPSSGPGSPQWGWPAAQFALSSPTGVLRVDFQAERIGATPKIPTIKPNQTPNGPQLTLNFYRIRNEMPEVWVDGSTKIYTVNGYYEFAMDKVPQDGDAISMGALPWTTLPFEDQTIALSDNSGDGSGMLHGIYDPATA